MNVRMMRRLAALFLFTGIMIWSRVATAEGRRVALIVGNGNYQAVTRLANPANDARAMDRALQAAGFETVVKIDARRRELYALIDEFATQISANSDTVGLFYYAGHGVQANGMNYLLPVDADVQTEADLEPEAIDAGRVLRAMNEAHNRFNIVILDACRDNPLPKVRARSASRGLARMDAPSGTFIAYAAGPGQAAQDGAEGTNGVFTAELLRAISEPDLPIEQAYKRVISGVSNRTGGRQVPWSETSLQGDFYFHHSIGTSPAPGPGGDKSTELAFWDSIKTSDDPADFKDYLERYPNGPFASLASRRLQGIKARLGSAVPPTADASVPGALSSGQQSPRSVHAIESYHEFGWAAGSANSKDPRSVRFFKITATKPTPDGLIVYYDWQNGVLRLHRDGNQLVGDWLQSNGSGLVELVFDGDGKFVVGRWNTGGNSQWHQAFLR